LTQTTVEIREARLHATAVYKTQYPEGGLLEFAFAGKSNVGKSSLINAMLNRNALARSSKSPGKTRTINFYEADFLIKRDGGAQNEGAKLLFADLPGYGYAKVSKSESAKWGAMVEKYLKGREPLKALVLLLDIRHEPGDNDRMLAEWCLHYKIPVIPVATKSDKLKKSQLLKYLSAVRKGIGSEANPIAFSSETKDGRAELWSAILDRAGLGVI